MSRNVDAADGMEHSNTHVSTGHSVLTTVFELLVLAVYAWRLLILRGRRLYELLSASLFGLTLEYFNILINDNYHYSERFLLQLGDPPVNVPLVIAMGWGLIITSSISLTDRLGIRFRPVADSVIALSIDLSMDVIAIRVEGGFWSWQIPLLDYPTDQGFYGVPWGNLTSWLYVVLIYSVVIRRSRRLPLGRGLFLYFLLAPVVAYFPLFVLIVGSIGLYFALGLREFIGPVGYQLLPIVVAALVFTYSLDPGLSNELGVENHARGSGSGKLTTTGGSDRSAGDLWVNHPVQNPSYMTPTSTMDSLPVFAIFHGYFLVVYLLLGLWSTIPLILWIELLLLVFALLLHALAEDIHTADA